MDPTIFHVDMDAFFVSVEELFDPSLKGKAVIVGGERNQRGVVSAASYEARKYGVHSAMPLLTAGRLCPHAIFRPGRREAYQEYSHQVHQVLCNYAPNVEMVSIDEAYLDLGGSVRLHGHPFHLAHRLRGEIEVKTGLSASIGISGSKTVSKVASDLAKPGGILYVLPGQEASLLAALKVGRLPGIGKITEKRLLDFGITTVKDLALVGPKFLSEVFGRWGESLHQKAVGIDTAHFAFHEEPKSISHEHTYEQDTNDSEVLKQTLVRLVQKVAHRLRDHKMLARTVTLKLRDLDFQTITRALTLKVPTHLDKDILEAVRHLLGRNWDGKLKVRLLGVALSGLSYGPIQHDLFQKYQRDRMSRLYEAADSVRSKFGFDAVTSGGTLK